MGMKRFSDLKEYVEKGNGWKHDVVEFENGVINYAHLSGVVESVLKDLINLIPCSKNDLLVLIEMAEDMRGSVCAWKDTGDCWESSCGLHFSTQPRRHSMHDGTPADNGMIYCPRCGMKIQSINY